MNVVLSARSALPLYFALAAPTMMILSPTLTQGFSVVVPPPPVGQLSLSQQRCHQPTAALLPLRSRSIQEPSGVLKAMKGFLDEQQQEMETDIHEQAYHKGGNAHYTNPAVRPSRLDSVRDDEEEECAEPFIDFATGDELCWNEDPTTANYPRNYDVDNNVDVTADGVVGASRRTSGGAAEKSAANVAVEPSAAATTRTTPSSSTSFSSSSERSSHAASPDAIDGSDDVPNKSYHKGGNAAYQAPTNYRPRRLGEGSDDEDCETPYIDLATGDELCWND